MSLTIAVDRELKSAAIIGLLERHLDTMRAHTPPESVHALDLDGLRKPEVTFWCVWDGDDLVGCGALKELDGAHGEIKSMHTAAEHRGKGIAATLVAHILDEARRRGYARLSLETGSPEPFHPALALYERHGFTRCGPFADYVYDPFSVYMTLEL
ncbi:MAG: GNAT family N-acetyltransferase [Hyphomicrobiales bacterium]|nr:MAG: GNAT family N-acetyltransferase [Hyphomicrobiales bacterium]